MRVDGTRTGFVVCSVVGWVSCDRGGVGDRENDKHQRGCARLVLLFRVMLCRVYGAVHCAFSLRGLSVVTECGDPALFVSIVC